LKTTEFMAFVAVSAMILISAAMIKGGDRSSVRGYLIHLAPKGRAPCVARSTDALAAVGHCVAAGPALAAVG
jgi:hypothetical protein